MPLGINEDATCVPESCIQEEARRDAPPKTVIGWWGKVAGSREGVRGA